MSLLFLLSSLSLKSGVRLALIPVCDFFYPSSVTDRISLPSPPPVSTPPSLALVLHQGSPFRCHSCQISLYAILPSQSQSSSSPSTLHSERIRSFRQPFPSIHSQCPLIPSVHSSQVSIHPKCPLIPSVHSSQESIHPKCPFIPR